LPSPAHIPGPAASRRLDSLLHTRPRQYGYPAIEETLPPAADRLVIDVGLRLNALALYRRARRGRCSATNANSELFPTVSGRAYGETGLSRALELNGARSNPRLAVELSRLGVLHDELLRRDFANPREPRPVPAKVSPVLETVTLVLELAERPMRACEIHAAACELDGAPLRWTSVKAALSAGVTGKRPRFRRVGHGVYETTESMSDRRPGTQRLQRRSSCSV
jgi:hypothetical protein